MNATPLKSSRSAEDASDSFKIDSDLKTTGNGKSQSESPGKADMSSWEAGMRRKLAAMTKNINVKNPSPPAEKSDDESNKDRLKTVKIEESNGEQPTSGESLNTPSTLMNTSIGTFTAGSSVSTSTFSGDVAHYLCIPVDSQGIADPSKAFFSTTPPENTQFAEECKKMGAMSSTDLVGYLHGRANEGRAANFATPQLRPDTPVSHLGLSASRARLPPDALGTPSPWTADSLAGLSRSLPQSLNRNGSGSLGHRSLLATMPEEGGAPPYPGSSATPDTHTSYSSSPAAQRRIVYSGDRGRIVPMGSVLSDSSINSLADGAKRVVLAKDGTPMACVGNTMEVLAPVETPVSDQRKWQRWTDSEDDILRSAVETEGNPHNWKKISKKYFLGVRSDTQCKNRWKKALQPGLIRGCWTDEEDKTIHESVENGMKFSDIAKLLPGRISEQVKERWVNTLDPSLKKEDWTADELHTLFAAQSRLGNQWKKISELLPGRSENHVKNRWYNAKQAQRRKMKKLAAETEIVERLKRARGDEQAAER